MKMPCIGLSKSKIISCSIERITLDDEKATFSAVELKRNCFGLDSGT